MARKEISQGSGRDGVYSAAGMKKTQPMLSSRFFRRPDIPATPFFVGAFARSEFFQFGQQLEIIGNSLLDKVNQPLTVDNVGRAFFTVELLQGAVIGNQRKTDVVFLNKFLMRFK